MRRLIYMLMLVVAFPCLAVLEFDGVGDYCEVATFDDLASATEFTVSIWCKQLALSASEVLVAQWDDDNALLRNYSLQTHTDPSKLIVYLSNNLANYTTGSILVAGEVAHIAVVYDGAQAATADKIKIYKDGVQVATTVAGSAVTSMNIWMPSLRFGNMENVASRFFDGELADPRIYNRALSSNEVASLYLQPPDPATGIPDASRGAEHYNKEANRDLLTATDWSGEGNDGVCSADTILTLGDDGEWVANLNGSDEKVNINDTVSDLTSTTTGAWSMWVKPTESEPSAAEIFVAFGDANANEYVILNLGGGGATGKLAARVFDGGVDKWFLLTDSQVFTDNVWAHIAVVQDGISPVLYVDGIEVAQTFSTTTDKTAWFADTAGIDTGNIGSIVYNSLVNTLYFDGEIDNVLIHDTALTSNQVYALAVNGTMPTNEAVLNINMTPPQKSLPALATIERFEADLLTAVDQSGEGNDGTPSGTGILTKGADGYYGDFNGSVDYIGIGSGLIGDLNSDFTLCTWYKPTDLSSRHYILGVGYFTHENNLVGITMDSGDNGFEFPVRDSAAVIAQANGGTASIGVWTHLALTWTASGNVVEGFVDGQSIGTGTASVGTGSFDLFTVGALRRPFTAYYAAATIDDTLVYDFKLSDQEILALYNGTMPTNEAVLNLNMTPEITDTLVLSTPLNSTSFRTDDETADVADVSGEGNHGSLEPSRSTGPTFVQGGGYDFDGSTEYIKVLHDDSLNIGVVDLSASCWIKTTSADVRRIVDKGSYDNAINGWNFAINSGKIWSSYCNGTARVFVLGNIAINDNEWHHLAITFDRDGNATSYVDGVLDIASAMSYEGVNIGNTRVVYVGAKGDTSGQFFDGLIKDVVIDKNTAWTISQVNDVMEGNVQSLDVELKMPFNSESYKFKDKSPNNIEITIEGSPIQKRR